jgi:hypothetical protein
MVRYKRCPICGHPFPPTKDHGQGGGGECGPCTRRAFEQIHAAHAGECAIPGLETETRVEVYTMAASSQMPLDCQSVQALVRRKLGINGAT